MTSTTQQSDTCHTYALIDMGQTEAVVEVYIQPSYRRAWCKVIHAAGTVGRGGKATVPALGTTNRRDAKGETIVQSGDELVLSYLAGASALEMLLATIPQEPGQQWQTILPSGPGWWNGREHVQPRAVEVERDPRW